MDLSRLEADEEMKELSDLVEQLKDAAEASPTVADELQAALHHNIYIFAYLRL